MEVKYFYFYSDFWTNRVGSPGNQKIKTNNGLNVFAINSNGGHLGHMTLAIHLNFHSPFLRMLHPKFGFDWPSGIREDFLIIW